jgi:hypothetical protein
VLAAIRDKKLYRAEFQTFEEYCLERWEMDVRTVTGLVSAAMFAQNVIGPIGPIPQREPHIRPLLEKLDNDKDREHVWGRVLARNERITAGSLQYQGKRLSPG